MSHFGLVLAGGGARGAYQVGVIRYLREGLPEPARSRVRFDVITGSSVGAINGTYLAAIADRPAEQGKLLQEAWSELQGIDLYHVGLRGLRRLPTWLLGAKLEAEGSSDRVGLLNSAPLEHMLREHVPWAQIERNLEAGLLHALSVSATDVATGRTFVFVQARNGDVPAWATDWRRVGVAARIGPEHALASAALPLLFPPVAIEGRYFCDGGLRQITPLSPALRLGAERTLVVSLRSLPDPDELLPSRESAALQAFPGAVFLVSKVLNSLLLDQLEHDLHTLEIVNSILETGVQVYGEDFKQHLDAAVTRVRGAPYRRARTLVLRPSRDLGLLAAARAEKARLRAPWRQVLSLGLKLAAPADQRAEGDILSYLFFDGDYLEELAQLGYDDAAARRDELVDFYCAEDPEAPDDTAPVTSAGAPLIN